MNRTSILHRVIGTREGQLALLLVVLFAVGTWASPFFLTPRNIENIVFSLMELAIVALPLGLVIIAGEIDISLASMMTLSGAVIGWFVLNGYSMPMAIGAALLVGILGGLLNGFIVTRLDLPSLIVTLGTLALFKGLASALLGSSSANKFPDVFAELGRGSLPLTSIPYSFLLFVILAVALGTLLHFTRQGRYLHFIGANKDAARFAGINVRSTKLAVFAFAGLIAAVAGVVVVSRTSTASAGNAEGALLPILTIVILGGVDIFGGKGTVGGIVLAAFVLGVVQNILRLINAGATAELFATGALLILAAAGPYVVAQARNRLRPAWGGAS
jgi:rhamnose transport system permease protein